jgi:hypothetical protein
MEIKHIMRRSPNDHFPHTTPYKSKKRKIPGIIGLNQIFLIYGIFS